MVRKLRTTVLLFAEDASVGGVAEYEERGLDGDCGYIRIGVRQDWRIPIGGTR